MRRAESLTLARERLIADIRDLELELRTKPHAGRTGSAELL